MTGFHVNVVQVFMTAPAGLVANICCTVRGSIIAGWAGWAGSPGRSLRPFWAGWSSWTNWTLGSFGACAGCQQENYGQQCDNRDVFFHFLKLLIFLEDQKKRS
jgi:hypothetical protein